MMVVQCSGGPLNGRGLILQPEDIQAGGLVEVAIAAEQLGSNKITTTDQAPDKETHFYSIVMAPTLVYEGTQRATEPGGLNKGRVIGPVDVDPYGS